MSGTMDATHTNGDGMLPSVETTLMIMGESCPTDCWNLGTGVAS